MTIDSALSQNNAEGTYVDGIFRLKDYAWKDVKFPFYGRRLDSTAGHLDFDADELGVNFDDSSRYNVADQIGIICQLNHNWVFESNLRPHIHWFQSSSDIPNMMMKYRVYKNGDAIPTTWTKVAWNAHHMTYTSGTILQISSFPEIDMTGIDTVSPFVDIKIYRDTANASSLFSGSDPLTGNALMKEFDFHKLIDGHGSDTELTKVIINN